MEHMRRFCKALGMSPLSVWASSDAAFKMWAYGTFQMVRATKAHFEGDDPVRVIIEPRALELSTT